MVRRGLITGAMRMVRTRSAPSPPSVAPDVPVVVDESNDDGGGGFLGLGNFKPPNPVSMLFDLPDLWEDFQQGVEYGVTLSIQVLIFSLMLYYISVRFAISFRLFTNVTIFWFSLDAIGMINRLLKISSWMIWILFSQDESYMRMLFNLLGSIVLIGSWWFRIDFGIAFGGMSAMLRQFIKGMWHKFNEKKDALDDKLQETAIRAAETVGCTLLRAPERTARMCAPMKAERIARRTMRTSARSGREYYNVEGGARLVKMASGSGEFGGQGDDQGDNDVIPPTLPQQEDESPLEIHTLLASIKRLQDLAASVQHDKEHTLSQERTDEAIGHLRASMDQFGSLRAKTSKKEAKAQARGDQSGIEYDLTPSPASSGAEMLKKDM